MVADSLRHKEWKAAPAEARIDRFLSLLYILHVVLPSLKEQDIQAHIH
jgi:hypothetical protein